MIPDGDFAALGKRLAQSPLVTVIQHGVDHANRAAALHEPRNELRLDWDVGEIARWIDLGWRRIRELPAALPVFAPPWNAYHPDLEEALHRLGFVGISGNEMWPGTGTLQRVCIDMDLMRWKDGARFRGVRRFLGRFTRLCRERRIRRNWLEPIGLQTHHLEHDERSWQFLENFIRAMKFAPAVEWCPLSEILGTTGAAMRPADSKKRPALHAAFELAHGAP